MFAVKNSSVITLHEVSQAHILRKLALYPFTIRRQHLIFTTQYEREFARKWAPWTSGVSSVIPVGSNIEALANGFERRSGEIAYFGLIMPRKGLEEVLKLAELIQSSGSRLQIRVIGKTDVKHEAYSAQLRLQSKGLPVIWEGDLSHEQVSRQLAVSSIAYLPFPDGASERRTSLNAMLSNGVVTITTRGAHTPSDLENAVKFCSSPRDAYDAIRLLLENPLEQEKIRGKATEYMRQFSWDRIVDLHLSVYERVIRSQVNRGLCHENALTSATARTSSLKNNQ